LVLIVFPVCLGRTESVFEMLRHYSNYPIEIVQFNSRLSQIGARWEPRTLLRYRHPISKPMGVLRRSLAVVQGFVDLVVGLSHAVPSTYNATHPADLGLSAPLVRLVHVVVAADECRFALTVSQSLASLSWGYLREGRFLDSRFAYRCFRLVVEIAQIALAEVATGALESILLQLTL
jgi:hypothetical protein